MMIATGKVGLGRGGPMEVRCREEVEDMGTRRWVGTDSEGLVDISKDLRSVSN